METELVPIRLEIVFRQTMLGIADDDFQPVEQAGVRDIQLI